jgi:integral membrane protein
MTLKTPLSRLRILAILEGISYLLLGITMPIKYMLDIPGPNYLVGMAHGILFILYVILSLQNIYLQKWGFWTSILILGASLIPVGTFIIDVKILRPITTRKNISS